MVGMQLQESPKKSKLPGRFCVRTHDSIIRHIFECAVAGALHKKGYQLYFYKNETTKKEIDVIIQKDGKVVPIEVKSGNTRANSLKSIMKNNKDISYGYKFIDGNVGTSEEGIITLPLYMIAFFDKVSE